MTSPYETFESLSKHGFYHVHMPAEEAQAVVNVTDEGIVLYASVAWCKQGTLLGQRFGENDRLKMIQLRPGSKLLKTEITQVRQVVKAELKTQVQNLKDQYEIHLSILLDDVAVFDDTFLTRKDYS